MSDARLLVVDDHLELLDFVGEALSREGFTVERAPNCARALELLGIGHFDLAVVDLGLPDGSGADICRSIREHQPDTYVLVLTANTAVASRVGALDAGADDYLMKPFALAELRARVRALLRRKRLPERPAHTYSRGDVRLDFEAKLAFAHGSRAPVTEREWTILRELMRAYPGFVSRAELLARAWPGGGQNKGASLDVLLSRVRQKLGADVIVTNRGVGVALAEGDDGE